MSTVRSNNSNLSYIRLPSSVSLAVRVRYITAKKMCIRDSAERYALSDINLHIKSGMTVGILGGTGSSKSSLVQLIPRLYDATAGTVSVGGVDVRKYDLDTLRGQVAMVLQKNMLFSGTIRENLRWGNENATDEELDEVCRIAQADSFVKSFPDGYDTFIDVYKRQVLQMPCGIVNALHY